MSQFTHKEQFVHNGVFNENTVLEYSVLNQLIDNTQHLHAVKAPLNNPIFTGAPQVPSKTGAAANNAHLIATEAQVHSAHTAANNAQNTADLKAEVRVGGNRVQALTFTLENSTLNISTVH